MTAKNKIMPELLTGKIDLLAINNKLNEAIGIQQKLSHRMDGIISGKNKLISIKEKLDEKRRKLNFIVEMDHKWGENGNDPDGYNFCVPPVTHVEYWSKNTIITHDWGKSPRYTKQELADVQQYFSWKKELGLPAEEPKRHDIEAFLKGAAKAVSTEGLRIFQEASSSIQFVVNELHESFGEELSQILNMNVNDLNDFNTEFNKGLAALDKEAQKWHEVNQKLLSHPLVEIVNIELAKPTLNLLLLKTVSANISFKILGGSHETELTLDLKDIEGSIMKSLKSFLPAEVSAL